MYKYINGMLPELFLKMFTSISDVHDYDTRQATKKKLSVPFKSTFRGQQSITYIGPHVWNFILSKINPICSIRSFKRHLRLLLQHCYVSDLKWWSLTFEKWNNNLKKMHMCAHICANTCLCTIPDMHVFLWYLDVYVHMTYYSFCFHYLCLRQTLVCITTDTVRCHYGMVNFCQNPDKRRTITCPLERDVGCLLWVQPLF